MPFASNLRPLWDRASEWACRLAMIRGAQRFLYLSTYYIEYDEYGVELLATLLEAQRRGVAVNLLVDRFGQRLGGALMTRGVRAALASRLTDLRDAGTVVTFYQPRHYLQRQLGGGQHVKIQVSEAGEAIFGTIDSWVVWNLTGGPDGGLHVTDVTNASRTQLMNLATLDWDDELLSAFKIPRAVLPRIVPSSEVYAASKLTTLADVPVAGILGDQQAALVSPTCNLNDSRLKGSFIQVCSYCWFVRV